MSGYGRGGRGAALLEALEKQARKPGQEAALQVGLWRQQCTPYTGYAGCAITTGIPVKFGTAHTR